MGNQYSALAIEKYGTLLKSFFLKKADMKSIIFKKAEPVTLPEPGSNQSLIAVWDNGNIRMAEEMTDYVGVHSWLITHSQRVNQHKKMSLKFYNIATDKLSLCPQGVGLEDSTYAADIKSGRYNMDVVDAEVVDVSDHKGPKPLAIDVIDVEVVDVSGNKGPKLLGGGGNRGKLGGGGQNTR